ncbi:MAG: hypothetical protein ABIV94_00910 [Acidimicrobiales bacterium]
MRIGATVDDEGPQRLRVWLQREHGLVATETGAAAALSAALAHPGDSAVVDVRGRDIVTGLPRLIAIAGAAIRAAASE